MRFLGLRKPEDLLSRSMCVIYYRVGIRLHAVSIVIFIVLSTNHNRGQFSLTNHLYPLQFTLILYFHVFHRTAYSLVSPNCQLNSYHWNQQTYSRKKCFKKRNSSFKNQRGPFTAKKISKNTGNAVIDEESSNWDKNIVSHWRAEEIPLYRLHENADRPQQSTAGCPSRGAW